MFVMLLGFACRARHELCALDNERFLKVYK